MVDIAAGIAALTAGIGFAKELRSLDRTVNEADFKLKIADLTVTLADAKLALVEAGEQLAARDNELEGLRQKLKFKAEETLSVRGFTIESREGEPVGPAFCPICEETGSFIRLTRDYVTPGRPHKCPKCKAIFNNAPEYAYPER